MTGVTVHVTLVNASGVGERHHVPLPRLVVMVAPGKSSAMRGQRHIRIVPILSAFTLVTGDQFGSLIILSP